MTGGPSPVLSNAIVVPSCERTVFMAFLPSLRARCGRPTAPGGLRAVLLREDRLAEPHVQRGHLDALVLPDELERLLEHERALGDQAGELLGRRLTDVRELLLLRGVHVDVLGTGVLTDDRALVDVLAGSDEQRPTFLEGEKGERRGHAGAVGHQRAGRAGAELAVPRLVPLEDVVELPGAARLG